MELKREREREKFLKPFYQTLVLLQLVLSVGKLEPVMFKVIAERSLFTPGCHWMHHKFGVFVCLFISEMQY